MIATGFWILRDPDAIQTDCTPIGPELCPLRLLPWIAIRGFRLEPWPSGSSAILSMTRNPRNWVRWIFAILAAILWIVDRLQIQCNPDTIQKIASGLQPNATNRPRIAPGRNQTGTHPNLTPKQSTQNIRTPILTAIFTIELNCNKIAKPQRIARGLKGLHQNPGKSTNCKKTSPIAPESAYFRNRSGIRVRSTQNRLLPMPDRGTIDPKTTSIKLDCNWIAKLKRIAIGLQN